MLVYYHRNKIKIARNNNNVLLINFIGENYNYMKLISMLKYEKMKLRLAGPIFVTLQISQSGANIGVITSTSELNSFL